MSLQIKDLKQSDQEEIKRILSLGELVAKDEEVLHLYARRDYLSKNMLQPFISRFEELNLAGYEKKEEVVSENKKSKK